MQRYLVSFDVEIPVMFDEKKVLSGIKRAMYGIPEDEHGFVLLDLARAIARAKLDKKLDDENQHCPFKVTNGDVGQNGKPFDGNEDE